MKRATAIVLAFCSVASPSRAMTFDVSKLDSGEPLVIAKGDIEAGDGERFRALVKEFRGGVLALSSDGGSVIDGIEMGRAAWRAGMSTMVAPRSSCLSACFLTFIGGRPARTVPQTSKLGSHQFYSPDDKRTASTVMAESQNVSAEILTYALQTGIDPQAITYIMQTPSDDMLVFEPEMLKDLRLTTQVETSPDPRNKIYLPKGTAQPGCPFPDNALAHDPLNLYPGCR